MSVTFEYSNASERSPGRVLTVLGSVFPGIRAVQEQALPYARAWQASNAAALEAAGPLWIALGDSMSQGIGASDFDRGFVGQLGERLVARGRAHRIVNLSVSGARIEDALERQVPAMEALAAEGLHPDLVTVLIGSNDVVTPRYRKGMDQRFAELLARLPTGAVVANLPNPHKEARAIDAMLRRAAADDEVVLADIRRHGPRSWRGRLAADRFHPNDKGYAAMADVFARALDEADRAG